MRLPSRRRLADGIFLVRFDTQYALASTFLRVQEHYESTRFRGRVFSLEDYMDWYATTFGAFTYFEDWSGFNVPSTALIPFYEGKFDPLSRKEMRLLRLFNNVPMPFYAIGATADTDLTHEIAHALFSMRASYRAEVLAAMRDFDTRAIAEELAAQGYHRRVLPDEVHAYLISSGRLPGEAKALRPLRRRLRTILRTHAGDLDVRP